MCISVPLYVHQQQIAGVHGKWHTAQLSNVNNNTCNLSGIQSAAKQHTALDNVQSINQSINQ